MDRCPIERKSARPFTMLRFFEITVVAGRKRERSLSLRGPTGSRGETRRGRSITRTLFPRRGLRDARFENNAKQRGKNGCCLTEIWGRKSPIGHLRLLFQRGGR